MISLRGLSLSLVFLMQLQTAAWAQTQQTTEPSATVTEAQQSVVKPQDSDAPTKGSFGVSLYFLGGYDKEQLDKYTDSSFAIYDSYLSFNYKFAKRYRVAARPAFAYTTAGKDYRGNEVTDKISLRDFSVQATQYDIFQDELPANIDMMQQARLYLPTSDSSKIEGMIARLRYEISARYFLGRYSKVSAWFKPSYYFQRTTAFVDDFGNTRVSRNIDSTHGMELDWNLNKYFSLKPGFEIEEKLSYSSGVNTCGTERRPVDCTSRRSSLIAYRMGVEVRPVRAMNFTIGIQDQRDLIDPEATSSGDISYSILTNISLY